MVANNQGGNIMDTYSIIEATIKFGTLLMLIWGIIQYILSGIRERYNKVRAKLSELQYYFQQLDVSIQNNVIAVLSQELSSKLFNTFEKDILLALLSTAQPINQITRLDPILRSVIQKNRDIQSLIKTCNRIQLLLGELEHVFPYYINLLSNLATPLIQYKKAKIAPHRLLFILRNKTVTRQLTEQLTEHGYSKLTKELFSNIIYQYISEESNRLNEPKTTSIQNEATARMDNTLIRTLLTRYIAFGNSKLLWIRYKQRIKKTVFDRKATNTTSLVLLLEKIQTDFNSEDKVTIFNQLEDLLHSMNSTTPTQS